MSALIKYKDNLSKFTRTVEDLPKILENNKAVKLILDESEYIAPIILLTIHNINRRNSKANHGYYMAAGIEIVTLLSKYFDNPTFYENKIDFNVLNELQFTIINCLTQNIGTLENGMDKNELSKVIEIYKYLSKKLCSLLKDVTHIENINSNTKMKKSDVLGYDFEDKKMIDKFSKMKKVNTEILLKYVESHYCEVYKFAFVAGWLLGLGDKNTIPILEKLGKHLGIMIKLTQDYENLERDLKHSDKITTNLLINLGVQDCFELFTESKIKFLETIPSDIFKPTLRDILENIEARFDKYIEKTEIDLVSNYSSFASST